MYHLPTFLTHLKVTLLYVLKAGSERMRRVGCSELFFYKNASQVAEMIS